MPLPAGIELTVTGAEEVEGKLSVLKQNFKEMGERTQRLTGGFRGLAGGLRDLGHLTRQLSIGIWILMSTQRRAREAAWEVQDAEEKYQNTIKEFGPHSEQARKALEQLTRSRIRERDASLQSTLTTAAWIVNIGVLVGQLIAQRIHLLATTGAIWGQVAATQALAHAWIPIAGLVLAGVAAGTALGMAYHTAKQEQAARAEAMTYGRGYGARMPGVVGGTIVGTAAGRGGVSVNIEKINVSADGKSIPAFIRDLKNAVRAARPEVW